MAIPVPIIGALIEGATGLFKGRQERKKIKVQAEAKLKLNQQLSDSEWEALGVQAGMDSWKDEYITVVVTLPIPLIFIGNIVAIFSPEAGQAVLKANTDALQQLGDLMETPYGTLILWVALAAVGIKGYKALAR